MHLKRHSNKGYARCLRILRITIATRELKIKAKASRQLSIYVTQWVVEEIIAVFPDLISLTYLSRTKSLFFDSLNAIVIKTILVTVCSLFLSFCLFVCFVCLFVLFASAGFNPGARTLGCGEYQFYLSSRGSRRPSLPGNEKGKVFSSSFLCPWVWYKLRNHSLRTEPWL